MKNLKYIFIFFLGALISSCDSSDTDGISSITSFPDFTLEGETFIQLPEGSTYTEPGAVAVEAGQELPVEIVVSGRFSGFSGTVPDGSVPDQYIVSYQAVNSDGFIGSAQRTVVVVNTDDLTQGLSGAYNSSTVRITGEAYSDILVLVWEVSPGVYEISSSIGGFYGDGRGFGDPFLARNGTITVNDLATNDFTFTRALMSGFGNTVGITSMTVDASTNTITFHASTDEFGNGDWDVTMVQIQP